MGRIENYLVDTDIFIDWFKGMEWGKKIFTSLPGKLYYSKVTRKELLSMTGISGKEKKRIKSFLDLFKLIDVDSQIGTKAVELSQSFGMHANDALIGATAIIKDMTLITRNIKHFKNIPDLKLYDLKINK